MKYHDYFELLNNNLTWVEGKTAADPDYFKDLRDGQQPPFLVIGCSDSRAPINLITKTEPGEVFIHRNIANQVHLGDMNFLSVLEYAVVHLQVRHIIVKGHTSCGGVTAAMQGNIGGLVENWVMPIRDLYIKNRAELDAITNVHTRADRLSEFNVILQVENLCKTSTLHRAFREGNYPFLHGWMFELHSGKIREVKLPLEKWTERGLISADYMERIESLFQVGK